MKVSLGGMKLFGFDSPQFRFYFFYLLDYSLQLRKCQFSLMDIFQFINKFFYIFYHFPSIDYLNILQVDDQWIRIFILRILMIMII